MARRFSWPALAWLAATTCAAPTPTVDPPPVFAELPFPTPVAADFAVNPRLGITTSRARLLVSFHADASDAAIADALLRADMRLVGADPRSRLAVLQLNGGPDWDALAAGRRALAGHDAVAAVVEDLLLSPERLPPAPARDDPAWRWSRGAWWIEAIKAPIAWNLEPALAWLRTREPTGRTPTVGLIDAEFADHPDLRGVLTIDGSRRGTTPVTDGFSHGAATSGLVAAAWNGRFTDGVTPFATLVGRVLGGLEGATPDDHTESFGQVLRTAIDLVGRHHPRIVNISLGLNWYNTCFAGEAGQPAARCDPKPVGRRAPDARCAADDVLSALREAARLLQSTVDVLQNDGPVLFVVSAGNSAGPMLAAGQSYCTARTRSALNAGLGDFPADYNSPMTYLGLRRGDPNVLVVGALAKPEAGAAASRAWFSNVGPHLLAPGDRVATLTGAGGHAAISDTESGTSFGAPIVSGAAAFLVALNPALDNRQLRALLIGPARRVDGESGYLGVLDLREAVMHMQVAIPGASRPVTGAMLLVDVDDGTRDGFTRLDPGGQPFLGRRQDWSDPRIDLADLRAFRDMRAILRGEGPVCPAAVPACDLNGDGLVARPEDERYPRIAFHGPTVRDEDLGLLARAWDGDRVQPFVAADLPALLRSADLHIDATRFLARAGAPELRFSLEGDQPAGAAPLAGTTGTQQLTLRTGVTLVTTPFLPLTRLRVQVGERTLSAEVTALQLAEDRPLTLNPCALDDPSRGLLDPAPCEDPPAPAPAPEPPAPPPAAGGPSLWSIRYQPPNHTAVAMALDGTTRDLSSALASDNLFGVEAGQGRVFFAGTNHLVAAQTPDGSLLAVAETSDVHDIALHGSGLIVVHSGWVERRTGDTLTVLTKHEEPGAIYESGCVVGARLVVAGKYLEDRTFKDGVTLYDADTLQKIATVPIPGKGLNHADCAGAHAWISEFQGDHTYRVDEAGGFVTLDTPRAGRVFAFTDRVWVAARDQVHVIDSATLTVHTRPISVNSVAFRDDGAVGWILSGSRLLVTDRDGATSQTIPLAARYDWLAYSGDGRDPVTRP